MKTSPVVPILGSGKNNFQFLHVDDLSIIINNAAKRKILGTYIVAGPESISYNDLIKLLMNELKIEKPVLRIPLNLLRPTAHILDIIFAYPPITPGQIYNLTKDRAYNISKVVKIFKYKPTPLRKGLKELISKEF